MKRFIINCISVIILSNACYAYEFPNPIYPVDTIENKEFVVEYYYNYFVQNYRQPLVLDLVERDKATYKTPEEAVIAFNSAMKSLDIQWYLQSWDLFSQEAIKQKINNIEYADRIKSEWKNLYEGSSLFLLARIERKEFIMFDVVIKNSAFEDFKARIKLVLENGSWKVTNKHSDDIIFNYSQQNINKIRLPGDN